MAYIEYADNGHASGCFWAPIMAEARAMASLRRARADRLKTLHGIRRKRKLTAAEQKELIRLTCLI